MDEHIGRILKMLEDGTITAADAESLISTLKVGKDAAPEAKPSTNSENGTDRGYTRPDWNSSKPQEPKEDDEFTKSFEFSWSHKKQFPFDLGNLSRQISDAVKKIDPERLVKEARSGVQKGGKRFQDRVKYWYRYMEGEDGKPENRMEDPTSVTVENISYEAAPDVTIQLENRFGDIAVVAGGDRVTIEASKEAWDITETRAYERTLEIKVEAMAYQVQGLGATRIDARVSAPDEFRNGFCNLKVTVPIGCTLKVETVFGKISVSDLVHVIDLHTVSGDVDASNLEGPVSIEAISGNIKIQNVTGKLRVAAKSGDISASGLKAAGEIIGVSGDIVVEKVEGESLETKSVSGDIHVHDVGQESPVSVRIESVSGDIVLRRANASVYMKTVSGDISSDALNATVIESQTVSGDQSIGLSMPFAGTMASSTVSGDTTVSMPESSSFKYSLATQAGELKCEFESTNTTSSGTLSTGTVGDGAGSINIQSRSGDLMLSRR